MAGAEDHKPSGAATTARWFRWPVIIRDLRTGPLRMAVLAVPGRAADPTVSARWRGLARGTTPGVDGDASRHAPVTSANWCAGTCRRGKVRRHRRVDTHRIRPGSPSRRSTAARPGRTVQPRLWSVAADQPVGPCSGRHAKVQPSPHSFVMEFIVRPVGTGSTTRPNASLASHGRGRPALWAAVVFGFAGLYLSARGRGAARIGAGRCYAAASLSTLMWCLMLGASYVAARPVLLRSLGRPGHSAAMSHVTVERVALLLMAAVIVGGAALVKLPSSPSGRGRRPPRA